MKEGITKNTTLFIEDIKVNHQYFGSVFANLEVEGLRTIIDLGATEIILKGTNSRRMFPFIYTILLVLLTILIIFKMFNIIDYVNPEPLTIS